MKWNPISQGPIPPGDGTGDPITRVKAAREICDYLLEEVSSLGIEDAARLVDAAAAALDEWLQEHESAPAGTPRTPRRSD